MKNGGQKKLQHTEESGEDRMSGGRRDKGSGVWEGEKEQGRRERKGVKDGVMTKRMEREGKGEIHGKNGGSGWREKQGRRGRQG